MATFGGMMLTSCEESELYSADAPEWIADSVSAVAARNAANAGEGIDKSSLGTLFETFTSTDWNWPKLHVEAQIGTWIFSSSDGKYTDVEIIGTDWWKAQSIDANADGSNWTSSDFDLSLDQELLLTFIPQTENAVVMWEFYGNGYWTTMSEGNWWFADDGDIKPTDENNGAKGSTSGYNHAEMGAYHFEPGTVVNVLITKSGKTCTLAVYGPTIEDYEASSIKIEGAPATLDFAENLTIDDLIKGAKVTVGFNNDAFTKEVKIEDCHFSVSPDLTTPGTKTVTIIYYLTNEGEAGTPVIGTYDVTLLSSIESIAVTTMPTTTEYYFYDNIVSNFDPTGMVVTAKSSDGSTMNLPTSSLTFSSLNATAGTQSVKIKFDKIETTINVTVRELTNGLLSVKNDGTIVGSGEYVEDTKFGNVYKNNTDNTVIRTNYLTLPTDKIQACAETGRLTISFWIKNYGSATISEWSPIFMIKNGDVNSEWLYYFFRHKGQLLINYNGYIDSPLNANWTAENDWLNGNDDWHYIVATVSNDDLTLYVDGNVLSTCSPNGGDGNNTSGFINGLADINFFAIGGAQSNGWKDPDLPCMYSNITISSINPNAESVKAEYESKK